MFLKSGVAIEGATFNDVSSTPTVTLVDTSKRRFLAFGSTANSFVDVTLPDATTLSLHRDFEITNTSNKQLRIYDNSATLLLTLQIDETRTLIATSIATAAGTWDFSNKILNRPRSLQITALDIDWNSSEMFWKDVSSNTTFTFSNVGDKVIIVVVNNTSGSAIIVTFPPALKPSSFTGTVDAYSEVIYTIVSNNGKNYVIDTESLFFST